MAVDLMRLERETPGWTYHKEFADKSGYVKVKPKRDGVKVLCGAAEMKVLATRY